MQTIAVDTNHSSVLVLMEGASAAPPLSELEMETVAGGLIFAPIIIAGQLYGAKGALATAGFMAGAGWELWQYFDNN